MFCPFAKDQDVRFFIEVLVNGKIAEAANALTWRGGPSVKALI